MFELNTILFTILLTDIMNPVLFAFMIYALGTNKPLLNSGMILTGHTIAYASAGFGVAYALEAVSHRLANPQYIDFILGLIIGILLFIVGLKLFFTKPKEEQEEKKQNLTPMKSLFLGVVINLIGIPFALPYFAAVDQILKADLSYLGSVYMLMIYNIAYALPFLMVIIFYLFYGDKSKSILSKINLVIERISAVLMPILLLIIGALLIVDAVRYFFYGEGLF